MQVRSIKAITFAPIIAAFLAVGALSGACDTTAPASAPNSTPVSAVEPEPTPPLISTTAPSTAVSPANTPASASIATTAPKPSPPPSGKQPTATPAPAHPTAAASPSTPLAAQKSPNGAVAPDPDYENALKDAGISSRGWDTDFTLHTVPYSEIKFVIPRDNIPSIDAPKFVAPSEASAWLKGVEPVVSLEVNGDARAYPLQILTWHEIVNDVVGDAPVAVTFCPLCNSAIAFDRRLDGVELEFGVSGNLRNSDLIMYDRQTHSWWQQFTGEGIVGEYAGGSLSHLPSFIVSFADFQQAHPDGKVLSRDTGYARQYGRNPYAGYDTTNGNPFLFTGDLDGRLLPVERVIAVTLGDVDVAFPLSIVQDEGAINYTIDERAIAVFHKFGATSALDASSIAESRDVGAAAVFDANLDGQTLTFSIKNDRIVDEQTGSVWDILGNAVEGPLMGKSLTPIVHGNHFWFAWAVFKPETLVYQGSDGA